MHQNDWKLLSWEIQGGQKVPKSSFNQEIKDPKKKKNEKKKVRAKEKKKKKRKTLPSWKLEDAT